MKTDDGQPPLSERQKRRNRVKAHAEKHRAEQVKVVRPNGRPRALDPDQAILDKSVATITGCASIGCTQKETAAVLGVNEDTLREFFARYPEVKEKFDDAREAGVASIRRQLFANMNAGNPQTAMWLGERMAGITDPYKEKEILQRERALEIRERAVKVQEEALALKAPDQANFGSIDIRSLSLAQLMQLAERIRQETAKALPASDVA